MDCEGAMRVSKRCREQPLPWEDVPDTGPFSGDDLARVRSKIDEVVRTYPSHKPMHREMLYKPYAFCVGRFLHQIAPRYLRNDTEVLGAPGAALGALPWFQKWLAGLETLRTRASFDEEVLLLVDAYPTHQPGRWDEVVVERSNGAEHKLVPRLVLEKLATRLARQGCPDGTSQKHRRLSMSTEARRRFEALPWASAWQARCRQACEVALMRKVVSKELKMELLLSNCRTACPRWEQVVPVCGPGLDGVYRWRPYTWLDDIADNWLKGNKKPGVVLDAAQMRAIESLKWTREWLDRIEALRDRKRARVAQTNVQSIAQ